MLATPAMPASPADERVLLQALSAREDPIVSLSTLLQPRKHLCRPHVHQAFALIPLLQALGQEDTFEAEEYQKVLYKPPKP